MPILLLVIIGAAAGFIATRLMRIEAGIVPTVLIGIAGALIGGLTLRFLMSILGAAAGFVGAILGALVLIWLYKTYSKR